MIEIRDLADPRLADFAHATAVELKNGRGPHGLYIAESALVLERALRAGHTPRAVLALGDSVEQAVALVGPDVPVFSGPGGLLAGLTGYQLHRGLIASLERPPLPVPESLLAGARRIVVLENVVDPTNVGAIFRSVAAIGADAVLITPRCSDPFYRRAIRVSMGTVFQVPWGRLEPWPGGLAELKALGFTVAALALTDDAASLDDVAAAPPEKLALVLGTEGDGLSRAAVAGADLVVRIPMSGGVDSLNVAAASAVAFWATR